VVASNIRPSTALQTDRQREGCKEGEEARQAPPLAVSLKPETHVCQQDLVEKREYIVSRRWNEVQGRDPSGMRKNIEEHDRDRFGCTILYKHKSTFLLG